MTDAELIAALRALIADAGAPITLADLVGAYEKYRPNVTGVLRFAALSVQFEGEAAAVGPAIQESLTHRFFSAVWTSLLERVDFSDSTPALQAQVQAITAASASGRFQGTMQQVLHAGGFGSVRVLPALDRAARATGLVKVRTPAGPLSFGTGFLVGPDLLLTAAHVVQSQIGQDGQQRQDSADNIRVEFHNLSEGTQPPVKSWVAAHWLEMMSPPLGAPPALGATTSPEAAQHLDFALIRLADPVGDRIGFLDVRTPAAAVAPSRLTIIGYPGGSDCLWDARELLQVDIAARVRHGVNALQGMSGSPCLGPEGTVIALHEGTVEAPPPSYNRGVVLQSIRQMLRQRNPDPLEDSATSFLVDDADAVREWVGAASGRFADTPTELAGWLNELPTSGDPMHPIIGRATWLAFVREAIRDAPRRVAFVTGQRWSGKSFSTTLLRAALQRTPVQLVRVGPEALRLPLPEVLERVSAEMAGVQPVAPAGAVDLRPVSGLARRDLVPDVLDDIERIVMARAERARTLWLVLDFGSPQRLASDLLDDWKQFVIAAAARQWMRIVVIGLREALQKEFAAALSPGSVYLETVAPASMEEFQQCMEGILRQVAPRVTVTQRRIDEFWNDIEPLSPPDGRMLEAVRAALLFRRQVSAA